MQKKSNTFDLMPSLIGAKRKKQKRINKIQPHKVFVKNYNNNFVLSTFELDSAPAVSQTHHLDIVIRRNLLDFSNVLSELKTGL